jgi:heptosyltransferase III
MVSGMKASAAPGSVLVIVTQQIGDVLLTTPLIQAARERWPAARIDVLGFAGTLAPLRGNPAISELVEVTRERGWRPRWALLRRLWRRYDLALVTQSGDRAQIYGWVAARERSSLVPLAGSGRLWKLAITRHPLAGARNRHAVLEKLMLLSPWVALDRLRVSVVPPLQAPLPSYLAALRRSPSVVVHVPSMWRYKQWPVEHFRVVVEALLREGVQVWLTGAGNDNDRQLTRGLLDLGVSPQLVDVVGQLDLGQVCELLAHADAYLGPDTSITHLAAAVGTPMVALFGPTPPTEWAPWPLGHPAQNPWGRRGLEPERIQRAGSARVPIVLMQGPSRAGDDCVPCGRAGCDDHRDSRSECLERLPPERVLAELRSLLARAAREARA